MAYRMNEPVLKKYSHNPPHIYAVQINKILNESNMIWYNYWDECLRDENSPYKHLNYIHLNPVKNGYVKKPEEHSLSSYRTYLLEKGEEWVADIFLRFPIIDFTKNDDLCF
jgi:putative transposase